MGKFNPGFNIETEVEIYLTAEGLKPSSFVTLEAIRLYNEERIQRGQTPCSPEMIVRIP